MNVTVTACAPEAPRSQTSLARAAPVPWWLCCGLLRGSHVPTGQGGGQHQGCDGPQLLPRGLSGAPGPGSLAAERKGVARGWLFTVKGRSSPPALGSSPTRQPLASADGGSPCVRGDRLPCTWLCLWRRWPHGDSRTASVRSSAQTEVSTTNVRQPGALRGGDTVLRACGSQTHDLVPVTGLPNATRGRRGQAPRGEQGCVRSSSRPWQQRGWWRNAAGGGGEAWPGTPRPPSRSHDR